MKIHRETWSIRQLKDARKVIDPRPQYQRSLVWDLPRKQLFIDSIVRGYDIPKIYLKGSRSGEEYEYEITDGQQRINAILDFYDDVYPLAKNTSIPEGSLGGLKYSQLSKEIKRSFDDFDLTIAYISECEQWELNDLFTRLQKGVSLLPVELRHAMMSELKDAVQKLLSHKFFATSKIIDRRFRRQDYLDHAIAACYFQGKTDLKAPTLYSLYNMLSEDKEAVKKLQQQVRQVLVTMEEINEQHPGIFKNKWGFVDAFTVFYRNPKQTKDIIQVGASLIEFEKERKRFTSDPDKLLEENVDCKYPKRLYDYIQAFTREGAFKNSVTKRYAIMEKVLFG